MRLKTRIEGLFRRRGDAHWKERLYLRVWLRSSTLLPCSPWSLPV